MVNKPIDESHIQKMNHKNTHDIVVQLNAALEAVGVALDDAEVVEFEGSLPTHVKTSSLPQEMG